MKKGAYGIVYQEIMRSPDLPGNAKLIYAYPGRSKRYLLLRSRQGSFPGRNRIPQDPGGNAKRV